MNGELARPLPDLDEPDTAPFWEGTARHEFRVPFCDRCGRPVWYPRGHCPACGSLDLTWRALPDPVSGTVYTFTVVRRHGDPYFAARTPYAVAWVDLHGGPRVLSEVRADDPAALRIGDPVVVEWEERSTDGSGPVVVYPVFRVVRTPSAATAR
ncbi:Zn-ribbon domain-containing OB-fold protein [Blastococcus sp. SYSU D00669]